jgi:hypothetical protein
LSKADLARTRMARSLRLSANDDSNTGLSEHIEVLQGAAGVEDDDTVGGFDAAVTE